MSRVRVRALLPAVLSLALACAHTEPFAAPPYGTNQPFAPGAPTRLTFNPLIDTEATWLPDGSALLYTARRLDFPDTTGCLEFLPPTGGQATRSICPPGPAPSDSTRVLESGVVSPSGRLVFVQSARSSLNVGWSVRRLVVTTLDPGAGWRVLRNIPFTGSVPPHSGITQIRWLDEDHIVYRGDQYYAIIPCLICPPIDADSGLFIVVADLRPDSGSFTVVPGTQDPTSVAVRDSDTIVYTLRGDSVVYRRALSAGTTTVLWNFGTGHVADGVQLSGNRLVALVDGQLTAVDLAVGTTAVIDATIYGHPALSPDGKRLVALRAGDLWLFDLP